jgi:quercetin dioxygenase-like cupin family protein
MPDQAHDPVHRCRYEFHPDGENMVVDTWMAPGGVLPPHYHPKQEERWWVVDGQVRIQLGSAKKVIGPEDGKQIVRSGAKHGLKAVSDREAHLRCEVIPAGHLQEVLEETCAAAQDGLFIRGGLPKNLRGARWAANFTKKHRDEVVFAFPPPFLQRALAAALAR